MTTADAASAAFCANLVRERDFESYAHSLLVPPDMRRSWLALAAFHCEISHVRDHVSQPLPGEIRLQWWRDLVSGGAGGHERTGDGGPVAAELLRAVAAYGLPDELLTRLVDAYVFDVYDDPMPDMAALEAHCRDTTSALYALRAQVLGRTSPDIARAADHAGVAQRLTDIMIDLPRHTARRQLYLPGDLMAVHNATPAQIFLQQVTPGLGEVLAHLRNEAHRQVAAALAIVAQLPAAARPAFLPLALVKPYLAWLDNASPFDPPAPSRLRILWTLWRAARRPPFRS